MPGFAPTHPSHAADAVERSKPQRRQSLSLGIKGCGSLETRADMHIRRRCGGVLGPADDRV
jgi:hypothetical protein